MLLSGSFVKNGFAFLAFFLVLSGASPVLAYALMDSPCTQAQVDETQLDRDNKNLIVCLADETPSYSWHNLAVPPSPSPPCANGNIALWNIASETWTCDEAKTGQCVVRNQVGAWDPCEPNADVYCNAKEVVGGGGAVAEANNELINNFPLTDDKGFLIGWRGNVKLPDECQQKDNRVTAYVVCCH